MIVLGMELKASEAIVVLVKIEGESIEWLASKPTRIALADGDTQEGVREFAGAMAQYLLQASPDAIYIRKRAKKGNFAGGAETFRMEGLVQYIANVPVTLVAPARITATQKKTDVVVPDRLAKYQQGAFACAWVGAAHSK